MTREEFYGFLSKSFEGESMESVATTLEKIRQEWVEAYRRQYFKGYQKCPQCNCYSKYADMEFKLVKAEEVLHYPEGPVTYDVKRGVHLCPKCQGVVDHLDYAWDMKKG